MDAKVAYWTGALINMVVLTGFAADGVRRIRRGDVRGHRHRMLIAAALVGAFIASYVLKLALLGRENLAVWSAAAINTLRFHELCVLAMLIFGGLALRIGLGLRGTSAVVTGGDAPDPAPRQISRHRLAGRLAIAGAALGVASAVAVLAGMYARL